MARGMNGSANGAGHVPTGRDAVEARLPGISNLPPAVSGALPAVVGLRTTIPKDRRSAQSLGSEREGHGILISGDGLIVTIGYLIMEADTVTITDIDGHERAAYIVGYDYVLLVPMHIDNVGPPYIPRPNSLGIDIDKDYQIMLTQLCKAYSARWHL